MTTEGKYFPINTKHEGNSLFLKNKKGRALIK